MRRVWLALAGMVALGATPLTAQAQGYGGGGQSSSDRQQSRQQEGERQERRPSRRERRAAAPDAATVAAAARTQGLAEAPAVASAANLRCTIADARFAGAGTQTDPTTNQPIPGSESRLYEVACSEGLGYILVGKTTGAPDALDCISAGADADRKAAAGTQGGVRCTLPANAEPFKGLQPEVTRLQPGCTVTRARYVGSSTAQRVNYYEVGCAAGPGLVLSTAQPGGTTASSSMNCLKASESGVACEYTPKAAQIAALGTLLQQRGKTCAVSDGRFVGDARGGSSFYEAACGAGNPGYMIETAANGSVVREVDCVRATGLLGGCTLTDAAVGQTAEAATYTGLARAAGFTCDVGQYRLLGTETNPPRRELVELQCKGRPEGGVAFFPLRTGADAGRAEVFDCNRITSRAQRCQLTTTEATFPRLTRELAGKNRTCTVNAVRNLGVQRSDGTEYVEVGCAAGAGYIIEYPRAAIFTAPTRVVPCAEAGEIGDGCRIGRTAAAPRR